MSDLAKVQNVPTAATLEQVLLGGDLAQLTPAQRVSYYRAVCESLGLNPLTKPFDYLRLSGKLILYARKDAAEQLRLRHGISVEHTKTEVTEGIYIVTVTVKDRDGRTDSDMGAVPIAGLKGEALANAMLKCMTKAKRRATLSICGLGMLDETEISSIPDARPVVVDTETGEIHENTSAPSRPNGGPRPVVEVVATAERSDGAVLLHSLSDERMSKRNKRFWELHYGNGRMAYVWTHELAEEIPKIIAGRHWVHLQLDLKNAEFPKLLEIAPAGTELEMPPDEDPVPF